MINSTPNVAPAAVAVAPPAEVQPRAPVKPVEATSESRGGTVRREGAGVRDLAKSARAYANLLDLTRDADVAALFSSFGRSMLRRFSVDVYA